jgi:diaminopimelate decarboxylase
MIPVEARHASPALAHHMLTDSEFQYRAGTLFCEDVNLTEIAASQGTPAYVYSKRGIETKYRAYEEALAGIPHRICYAVKANSNLAVLQTLARLGASFDIVSAGELFRVLKAGARADTVVFSGVGKTPEEVRYAIENGIHSFNCESEAELHLLSTVASNLQTCISVAFRVNPDVDAITHPYISTGLREHKFGADIGSVESLYEYAMKQPGIRPEGVSCHIGSQLLDLQPLWEAAEKVLALVRRLRRSGVPIRELDLGGGLGVPYRSTEHSVSVSDFISGLRDRLEGEDLRLLLEPGRSIVAEAGILLTKVLFTKRNGQKNFVIVDAAMNDLIRPTLYQAHHEIVPVVKTAHAERVIADIVGPVCETGDFFARGRELPEVSAGSLLAIRTAGAYGFVLSSNYNSRPRVCELLVDDARVHVARRRETFEDLIRGEELLQ